MKKQQSASICIQCHNKRSRDVLSLSTVIAHASNTRDAVAMWLSVTSRSVSIVRIQLLVPVAKVSGSGAFTFEKRDPSSHPQLSPKGEQGLCL